MSATRMVLFFYCHEMISDYNYTEDTLNYKNDDDVIKMKI